MTECNSNSLYKEWTYMYNVLTNCNTVQVHAGMGGGGWEWISQYTSLSTTPSLKKILHLCLWLIYILCNNNENKNFVYESMLWECYHRLILSLIIIFIIHYCQQCTATYIIDLIYSITIHVFYTSLLTCTRYGLCTSAFKKDLNIITSLWKDVL